MATVHLLSYNNYYNRQVKYLSNLSDYHSYIVQTDVNMNFIPNDGVNTEYVCNIKTNTIPNYLIVEDGDNISRWFILDDTKLSRQQFKLQLRRDLIADAYNDIMQAPMFIEKATLQNNDPMILNSENMTYNQIKQSETLLKDKSNTAWIVGYMARNDGEGNITHINGTITPPTEQYISLTTISPSQFSQTKKTIVNKFTIIDTDYGYKNNVISCTRVRYRSVSNSSSNELLFENSLASVFYTNLWSVGKYPTGNPFDKNPYDFDDINSTIINSLNYISESDFNNFVNTYNGNKIKLSDGNIYEVNIEVAIDFDKSLDATSIPSLKEKLDTSVNTKLLVEAVQDINEKGNPYNIMISEKVYTVTLNKIFVDGTYDYNIPTTRKHLTDAPYDMFAIPFNPTKETSLVEIYDDDLGGYIVEEYPSNIAMLIAQEISEKWGATMYDLQLLPYCPLPALLNQPGSLYMNLDDLTENQDYTFIKLDNENKGIIFFPNNCNFSRTITLTNPIQITNPKVQSECDMYRLCSSNYQGVFEFNAAKNGGLTSFDIDCTYLPFNPYIHINPNFGLLYGKDFDDVRGLVCGGDFSLARISDAWTSYQLTNKNYMASFNRQIQNMEVQNKYARLNDILGASVGGLAGGVAGAKLGGPVGAIAGGLVSAGAGIADVAINENIRQENMDYTRDMFGYNLGNIKAVPDSLAKTTAYTNNNKYFPFLEYYTCTEEEKQALINKIKYNGMTVMRIGTIDEFIQSEPSYIKGKLIRLEGTYDNHYTNELSQELYKGVYI